MVDALQPCRISTKGSFWSGALGCSNTPARRHFYITVPLMFLVLSGCGEKIVAVGTKPPAELLVCADEAIAPILPPKDGTEATQLVRDSLTLGYVLAMRAAWGDCKADVVGTKAWSDALP